MMWVIVFIIWLMVVIGSLFFQIYELANGRMMTSREVTYFILGIVSIGTPCIYALTN